MGNIYGIYDMSGGSEEYVMGNMSSESGTYIYYGNCDGGNFLYDGNEKYLTTYAYGSSSNDQTAYNRGRLGDATSEVVSEYGDSWNNGYVDFYYESAWPRRLDIFSFHFSVWGGAAYNSHSTRAVLAVFP